MSRFKSPLSPRIRRRLRRAKKRPSGWVAAGACVALSVAGIVLSQGQSAAAENPIPVVTPPSIPVAASNQASTFATPSVSGTLSTSHAGYLPGGPERLLADIQVQGRSDGAQVRQPIAMSLVLDTSGSMAGQKIIQARQSVIQAFNRLQPGDYFGLVTYDSQARVVIPMAPVEHHRATLPMMVSRIHAGGGTMIPQGLQLGHQALLSSPQTHVRRIALISDGNDGSGIGVAGIRNRVSQIVRQNATVAALGIGTDYDESYMTAVADSGRGAYAFLQNGSELSGFLAREIQLSGMTVASNVAVHVGLPTGARILAVHGAEFTGNMGTSTISFGTLAAGEKRRAIVELDTSGCAGNIALSPRLSALDSRTRTPVEAHGAAVQLAALTTPAELEASRNAEVFARGNAVLLEASQAQAVELWRQGRVEESQALARGNAGRIRELRGIADFEGAAELADEFEADATNFATPAASAAGRSYGLRQNARRRARVRGRR